MSVREYCLLSEQGTQILIRSLFLFVITFLIVGCADLGYYWHSAKGHLAIMNKRVPISELITNPEIDNGLRRQLVLVQEIRQFSIDRLALPESGSYTDYAQLDHPYALQNLFAAPEFSTRLLSWCYPVAGCTSYRGFYEQGRLDEFIAELKTDKHDIHVAMIPAYSTLGWFDDPVLSSFIDWPEFRLAGLLFHELTHHRIYIDGDSRFNESLATAVQHAGTRLWLTSRQQDSELESLNRSIAYRQEIVLMIESIRSQLAELYQLEESDEYKRDRKQQLFNSARQQYQEIAGRHDYRDGFEHWFAAELNNAKLASVSTYNVLVPSFISMIEAFDHDFERFFDYVENIGDLDREDRDLCLKEWQSGNATNSTNCG